MTKPKAFFVAGRPPYPKDNGAKIRSWHVLKGLCSAFHVDVLLYSDPADNTEWIKALNRLGVEGITHLENPLLNQSVSPVMFLNSLLRGLPASVIKYQRANMSKKFLEICRQGYDLIHFEHVHMSGLMKYLTGLDVVCSLNAHNVETEIALRMRELENHLPRKLALSMHAANMARFEKKAIRNSDIVLAVSKQEVERIKSIAFPEKPRVMLVANGVDLDYFRPIQSSRNKDIKNLVFVGSMDWLPNVDGVKWFFHEVWPQVKSRYPNCYFTIVGRNPDPSIKELEDKEKGIHVTGTVDDVRPYVWDASAVVVPLRFGSGTRLKILEAFSMGAPVVSTTFGCEGIECLDGHNILRADNPVAFADKCCQLLNDRQGANQLAQQALTLVQQKYSWDTIIEGMIKELAELLMRKQPV